MENQHENRQGQTVKTASERKTESKGPDIIALPPPPPFSRKQTEPLKVFAFMSLYPSAKCRMAITSATLQSLRNREQDPCEVLLASNKTQSRGVLTASCRQPCALASS